MQGMRTQQECKQSGTELPPLENYQREAVDHIYSKWKKEINTLCALDVGMGKTRVACEIIARLFERTASPRLRGYALVCCSTTGVRDTIWKETLEKYNQKTIVLEDEQFSRIKLKTKKTLAVPPLTTCLITYANLCREDNIIYFQSKPPNLIIFDEYHILTNNSFKKDSQYRNAVMTLPIRYRIGLTATPFVNNEMESVMAYGLLNDTNIIKTFLLNGPEERKSLVQTVKEKDFLFYRSNPYNLTRRSEWLVSIPMGREHYNQYLKVHKDYEGDKMSSLHKIGKLTVSPLLLDKKVRIGLNQALETGKIKALKSIVEHLPDGDKLVVFDNYRETLKYIKRLEFMRPLKPVLYIGGSKAENETSFERFTNNSDFRALLTTRQQGGEGLNLQTANHLVLLNCWWTVKDIIQILGRIKRKGQEKPVYSYILGYNLFDCLEFGKAPDSYILPEDGDFYKSIREKKEMCEDWGIEVEDKLPPLKVFFDLSTFEKDFNNFLDGTIIKKLPEFRLEPDEEFYEEENEKNDFINREAQAGETLLQYLYFLYCQHFIEKSKPQKIDVRRKIIVVKKKNKS